MAKYVLGEEGARKFKQLTKQVTGIKNRISLSPTHVIDNLYPHPYEVRWTESQISGGGYEIWLPPKCLQVDGTNINPDQWLPLSGKIDADSQDNWWYRLKDKIINVGSSVNVDELSSFNLYLNSSLDEVVLTLSADDVWYGSNGFVHIAEIDNYRSKPNVKSNLILDNTRRRPFDLVADAHYNGPAHQWIMQSTIWEYEAQTIAIPGDFLVPAPSVDSATSSTSYGLRLVHVDSDEWLVDRVTMDGPYDLATLNMLSVGQQLSQPVASDNVEAVYPLYILGAAGGVWLDLRDAWYIINDALSCDDVSITKDRNVDGGLSSEWRDKIRLWGFHSVGDSTTYDVTTSFVVRQNGGGVATPPSGDERLDYLNVWGFRTGIMQQVADTLLSGHGGGVLSALEFDEQSVSKGGDGWSATDLSGNTVPTIHMWHFHDNGADVDSPEMCDIVLRYNPLSASSDKWLRYISYDDFKAKLSADIGGGGSGSGGEISADQLSAIPSPGMFAWTEKTRNMGVGGCMVGRQWYTASGTGAGKGDGLYQVCVTINSSGNVNVAVVSNASLGQAPTTTQCWIPIYQISGGKIAADYRGAFVVPAFD